MNQLRTPLTAGAVDEYVNHITARLTAGDNAAALETSLRNFDSLAGNDTVKDRLKQAIESTKETRHLTNGNVTATMTLAGTGYAVGDVIPITGDGTGGAITVLTVGIGGEILTFEGSAGEDYVSSAAADTTGVGNADATFTVAIDNELQTLEDAATAIAAAV